MKDDTIDTDKIARTLLDEEIERCMLNSLVMCLFARKIYDRPTILKALAAIDIHLIDEGLTAIARRILATKLRIKKALNFDLKDIRIPKRFFETPSMRGVLNEETAYEILQKYRELVNHLEDEHDGNNSNGELGEAVSARDHRSYFD